MTFKIVTKYNKNNSKNNNNKIRNKKYKKQYCIFQAAPANWIYTHNCKKNVTLYLIIATLFAFLSQM